MRRLVNLLLILVMLGAVGFVLVKARIIPLGALSGPEVVPTVVPSVPRENLRISVAHRPEALIVSALQRLLEVEGHKVEIVEFDPETAWMELAAGEIDVVIAPIGEAITGQGRFQAGRFLFISGLSQGYDAIVSPAPLAGPLKTLGISGGQGSELFAISKFPEAQVLFASNQTELQNWLLEGAVQAAVLESAGLNRELSQNATRLGGTSVDASMPTVVVLSERLAEETAETKKRLEILMATLDSWDQLIGYFTSEPKILRSTLRTEARDMGVDLEILLKDYRFFTPIQGRQALLEGSQAGLLKQTLDLLVLAKTRNLTAPNWDKTLTLSPSLEQMLASTSASGSPTPLTPESTPTALLPSATPALTASPTPLAPLESFTGSRHVAGKAPSTRWTKPKTVKVEKAQNLPCALTDNLVGVATSDGLVAYSPNGEVAFRTKSGPPVAAPLADPSTFYVFLDKKLEAIDEKGKSLWSFSFEGAPSASAVMTDANLIFTVSLSDGHKLLAVKRENGELAWQKDLDSPPASAPVQASEPQSSILLVDEAGQLQAWSSETGSPLWQSSLSKPSSLAPATLGDVVAVASPQGQIQLLSLADGRELWATELGSPIDTSPTLTATSVVLPAQDQTVYALDRKDGSIRSKADLTGTPSTAGVAVEDYLFVCDQEGGVHCLKTNSKLAVEWSANPAKASALTGPAFSSKNFALLAADGTLLIYPR